MELPKVGDSIPVKSDFFTGDAVIVYIDEPSLFVHHEYPIQVEISEADLDQLEDHNHGQTVFRISLKEIVAGEKSQPAPMTFEENVQGDLFDGF